MDSDYKFISPFFFSFSIDKICLKTLKTVLDHLEKQLCFRGQSTVVRCGLSSLMYDTNSNLLGKQTVQDH